MCIYCEYVYQLYPKLPLPWSTLKLQTTPRARLLPGSPALPTSSSASLDLESSKCCAAQLLRDASWPGSPTSSSRLRQKNPGKERKKYEKKIEKRERMTKNEKNEKRKKSFMLPCPSVSTSEISGATGQEKNIVPLGKGLGLEPGKR